MHPAPLLEKYMDYLKHSRIPPSFHAEYQQLLSSYLDFCEKTPLPDSKSDRISRFCAQLREKSQTPQQQQRAANAVSVYLAMLKQEGLDHPFRCSEEGIQIRGDGNVTVPVLLPPKLPLSISSDIRPTRPDGDSVHPHSSLHTSNYLDAGYEVKSDSPVWDAVLERLAAEIKVRHYSRKTLRTYANWSRRFQRFLRNKPPDQLSTADVKEYLTFLAVTRHVAASERFLGTQYLVTEEQRRAR